MAELQNIITSLNLLHPHGGIRNLRVLHHFGGMGSTFFKTTEKLAEAVVGVDTDVNSKAVYVQLQEIDPESIGDIEKGGGVSRRHISRYLWLCIDVDTTRHLPKEEQAKSNATDEEKTKSWEVVRAVHGYMRSCGWPSGVIADSGNGWHILFAVDLAYDRLLERNDPNYRMLWDCLKALAAKFDTPEGKVDTSLAEPEQIIKLWGTMVRKARVSTEERPWRESSLIKVPENIEVVPLALLQNLAAEAPKPTVVPCAKKRAMPGMHEEFDLDTFIDFWSEALDEADVVNGWSLCGETESKSDGCTYHPMDWCPTAERSHSGDYKKSCLVEGDTLGWKCFSDDCDGLGIGDLLRKLHELTGKSYPYPLFEDDDATLFEGVEMLGIDDMPLDAEDEGAISQETPTIPLTVEEQMAILGATEVLREEVVQAAAPVAEEPHEITPREKFGDDTPEQLGESVLNILFRDPEASFSNFALYKKRLQGRIKQVENDELRHTLHYLYGYLHEFQRLPSKNEVVDFIRNHSRNTDDSGDDKHSAIDYIRSLVDEDKTVTLDTTMQRFFHKTDLRVEKKAFKKAYDILKTGEDIQKARGVLRKVWTESLAIGGDHGFKPGAIQEPDHIEYLKEQFRKDIEGTTDDRKFSTGYPSMDFSTLNIGLDNEHAIAVYGASNNGKTSVVLSLAYNFAQQGKNGVIFVGEHHAAKVEKRLALMHSYQFRNMFTIPAISRWEGKGFRPTQRDLTNLYTVLDDLQSMKTVLGYIEVQNINSIGGTLDSVFAYIEAGKKKYDWDFFIIDPLDSVVSESDKNGKDNGWAAGKEAVNRLFDYTRDYNGGRGILCAVTAQLLSKPAREVERLQQEEDEDINGICDVLKQDKQIQLFTTLSQRFDLALGVALTRKKGSEGIVVQGRTREGSDFDYLKFKLDPHSWYATEKNPPSTRAIDVEFLNPDDVY